MALYVNINRSYLNFHRFTPSLLKRFPKLFCQGKTQEKNITVEVDILDEFTTQLLQKKIVKWEMKKHRLTNNKNNNFNINNLISKVNEEVSEDIDCDQVNMLFQNAINTEDNIKLMFLMRQCLKQSLCPPYIILSYVLSFCSQNGDREMIMKIRDLCEKEQPSILQANSNFKHYLAEAIWMKGDITKSIKIFDEVYRENGFLRRKIRVMLKYLINNTIGRRSEAALVNMLSFSEKLVTDFNDYHPLSCVWEECFLSEWFTDQCIAIKLLEKIEGLCDVLANRIPFVVNLSLKNEQLDVVYRLLEVLLVKNMTPQYSGLLISLFDYHLKQRDLHCCNEIIQWSLDNNVQLPSIQHENFLNLLLNANVKSKSRMLNLEKISKVNYDLKF